MNTTQAKRELAEFVRRAKAETVDRPSREENRLDAARWVVNYWRQYLPPKLQRCVEEISEKVEARDEWALELAFDCLIVSLGNRIDDVRRLDSYFAMCLMTHVPWAQQRLDQKFAGAAA